MIGNKIKDFSFGKIIKQEDLTLLNNFITSEYKNVKYSIQTKNNISFDLENYDELVSYENFTESKIIWIRIFANKEMENKYFAYPDLSLFIGEYKTEYEIRKSSENDILYVSNKINNLIYNFKSPHSWISTFFGGWLINIILLLPVIIFSSKIIKELGSLLEIPWNYILFYVILLLMGELLAMLKTYLYPKTCFLIGGQIKKYERKKQIRKILIGSLITIYTSLISTYIVSLF